MKVPKRMVHCIWRYLTVTVLLATSVGCAHQRIIDSSQPVPPSWKLTPPQPSDEKRFFVGRSLGLNVLDEKQAINKAIDDAAYQIARAITADVSGTVEIIDSRKTEDKRRSGLTGDKVVHVIRSDQSSHDQVVVNVRGIVIGLVQEDTYWERWSVRDTWLGPKLKRYKYWLLESFPQAELHRLQNEVKKKLKTS